MICIARPIPNALPLPEGEERISVAWDIFDSFVS